MRCGGKIAHSTVPSVTAGPSGPGAGASAGTTGWKKPLGRQARRRRKTALYFQEVGDYYRRCVLVELMAITRGK